MASGAGRGGERGCAPNGKGVAPRKSIKPSSAQAPSLPRPAPPPLRPLHHTIFLLHIGSRRRIPPLLGSGRTVRPCRDAQFVLAWLAWPTGMPTGRQAGSSLLSPGQVLIYLLADEGVECCPHPSRPAAGRPASPAWEGKQGKTPFHHTAGRGGALPASSPRLDFHYSPSPRQRPFFSTTLPTHGPAAPPPRTVAKLQRN